MRLEHWPAEARRVLVYGVTGSGKTTLAQRLAGITGLPWWAVDELTWEPGWTPVPTEQQRERIGQICAGERWILDHGYGQWLDVVLPRCDVVVALDYPRLTSLARLVRRSVARMVRRTPTCNGNLETLDRLIASDSIIRWHFASFARKHERIAGWEAAADGPAVLRFRTPRAADAWLRALRSGLDV